MNYYIAKAFGALFVAAFVLQACTTMQSAATSPDYKRTRTGAGIGAAAGGVIGLLTHGNKLHNALIGAALGGIAGGAIGNYQDRQQSKLQEQMAGTGVDVVRQGDNITLDMPGGVTFLRVRMFGPSPTVFWISSRER